MKTKHTFAFCTTCGAALMRPTKTGLCKPCASRAATLRTMTRTCGEDGCTAKVRNRNESGLCLIHRRAADISRRAKADSSIDKWGGPDPAQPERVCQRAGCRKLFVPAGPFNKYFCSPQCQDAANDDLGYAYRMERGANTPRRGIRVRETMA
jgi:hypothetical protein